MIAFVFLRWPTAIGQPLRGSGMLKTSTGLLAGLLLSAMVQADSNQGNIYWESVECDGVKADLMINHRTVSQPTLFMNGYEILLENGPNYSGPVCVFFRGEHKVGFVEYMGNAYELYRLVDLDTFETEEISYRQAEKIWP